LNVMRLELPPLKERVQDIPLLINHFLRKNNLERGKNIRGFEPPALNILLQHDYPGNIRELENIIEHACLLCRAESVQADDLPAQMQPKRGARVTETAAGGPVLDEAQALRAALKTHGWKRQETARALGLDRTTLWRKMKRHNLKP
jgi:DNA-binding NtrC family response regulator